ncbi:DnaJ C-terminal domain-containing protein [Thioalkalivibrio sp. XN279]|uniref:DnaJ C-terminal domain-containing protein n=1 Tax=Thioalkalivibrio sp. XN279 TaxID=2714953 RepID=UPI00140C9F87|nr:DnaJ C-terminal domain-containing protein [Thioalkalivibrio sp. XN279]NHA15394.1 DnaJ domain-containing protein [Thioalkalivibrio sp. XN279]
MDFKDYYAILGVKRDASADEIKRAYRKLARKYHPDVSKEPDAEARFKEVGEAYEVLKDPEKRAAYDQLGADWKAGQEFRPPPGDGGFYYRRGGPAGGAGMGGAGEEFGGFSDFFETLFGRGGMAGRGGEFRSGPAGAGPGARPGAQEFHFRQAGPMRGEDQHARVQISLEDAYHGASRTLELRAPSGGKRSIRVAIPKGVTAGQRIRLAGQGMPGANGGAAGDLFLEVAFTPHRLFEPDGRNILLTLPVTPWEAALGETVSVPTLGGKVELKIPAGSQSGRRLRLKGRGLPGTPPGDQIVTLRIDTPPADSSFARTLYEEMASKLPFNPRHDLES